MSFPKYYVTYCVMDGDAGANPLGHAALLLSVQIEAEDPIQVVDAVGFYSQPSTTTNPLYRALKYILGFNIDLQDGHGVLKQEELRWLAGNGLHGINFETTKDRFERIKRLYVQEMALENAAIEEADAYLEKNKMPKNGYTRFTLEKQWAKEQNRPSRLSPFHLSFSLGWNGFESIDSYACKNKALHFLLESGVIDELTRDEIIGGAAKHAFPRFSDLSPAPILLVNTGAAEKHTSRRSQKTYFKRDWNTNDLFWATTLNTQEAGLLNTDLDATQRQYQPMRNILTRMRKIELMLLQKIDELENSIDFDDQLSSLKKQLARVQALSVDFRKSHENQRPELFSAKILRAEKILDVAALSLTPDRVNYSFMLRAYESVAIHHTLLSLLCIMVAVVLISGPVLGAVITAPILYAGHQLNRFFKEEAQHSKMSGHYREFLEVEGKSEADAGNENRLVRA